MKPRTRNAWFTLTDSQGRHWRACWKPWPGHLVLSASNGKRRAPSAYLITADQITYLGKMAGKVVGPPVQTEIPMP
jgi:hypothetical protein